MQIISCIKCQSLFSGKNEKKKYFIMSSIEFFTQHLFISVVSGLGC